MKQQRPLVRLILCALSLAGWGSPLFAAPMSEEAALAAFSASDKGSEILQGRAVASVERFKVSGTAYSLYAVRLSPTGFVILNTDSRLRAVIAYSRENSLDLRPIDDLGRANPFHDMLAHYATESSKRLEVLEEDGVQEASPLDEEDSPLNDVNIGPLMSTTWDQTNHYNDWCPTDANAPFGYDGRVPVGCVATAYAQILNFHQWPIKGTGSYSYTDSDGLNTGSYTADYSDPFEWANMQDSYNPLGSEPAAAVDAIAELMFEMAVSAEMDFEGNGSGSFSGTLSSQADANLYYESPVSSYLLFGDTFNEIITAITNDILAGYPSIVTIPGHAVVADGYKSISGDEELHINYGWGGTNNAWYALDDLMITQIDGSETGIIPEACAFPIDPTVAAFEDYPVELEWFLPQSRLSDILSLNLYTASTTTGSYTDDCEDLNAMTGSGWQIATNGETDNCWFINVVMDGSPLFGQSSIQFLDPVTPTATSQLSFRTKHNFADLGQTFIISISTDGGQSFMDLLTITIEDDTGSSWETRTFDLSAYAGEEVIIRFTQNVGSGVTTYNPTPNGGIRIDSLVVTNASWDAWVLLEKVSTISQRSQSPGSKDPVQSYISTTFPDGGSQTVIGRVETAAGEGQAIESFTVNVLADDLDGMPIAYELSNGLDPNSDDSALDLDFDGRSNMEEWLEGTNPGNGGDFFTFGVSTSGVITFDAPVGRSYTIETTFDLVSGPWLAAASGTVPGSGSVSESIPLPGGELDIYYRIVLND
jgi:hypothetical protein